MSSDMGHCFITSTFTISRGKKPQISQFLIWGKENAPISQFKMWIGTKTHQSINLKFEEQNAPISQLKIRKKYQ